MQTRDLGLDDGWDLLLLAKDGARFANARGEKEARALPVIRDSRRKLRLTRPKDHGVTKQQRSFFLVPTIFLSGSLLIRTRRRRLPEADVLHDGTT